MNKIHTTKEGKQLFICQMETSHLLNYCLQVTSNCLTQVGKLNFSPNVKYMSGLYNLPQEGFDPIKMGKMVATALDLLYPYLAELFMREFNETQQTKVNQLREQLTTLTGREQLPAMQLLSAPPAVGAICEWCGEYEDVCNCFYGDVEFD